MTDTCQSPPSLPLWLGRGRDLHYPIAAPRDGRQPTPRDIEFLRQCFLAGSQPQPDGCTRLSQAYGNCDARFSLDAGHLTGEHMLSGVDFIPGAGNDPAELRFILGDTTYAAIEDPSDGHRSCLKGVFIIKDKIANTFPPVPVVVAQVNDAYRKISTVTVIASGRVVLEFGTDNWDDHYPVFVARFDPTALGER